MSALSLGLYDYQSIKEEFLYLPNVPLPHFYNNFISIINKNGQGFGILFRSVEFLVLLSV